MATFISLVNFTDQGIRKDAVTPFKPFLVNEGAADSGPGERQSHLQALKRPHKK